MLPGGGGLLIRPLGPLARLDLADHAPLTDFHHQMVDRRLLRQRKHIDSLEPGARRIDEVLPHCRPHDRARDHQFDVGPQDRRLIEHAGLIRLEEQPALRRLLARLRVDRGRCEKE
jgi:hypothetical protein